MQRASLRSRTRYGTLLLFGLALLVGSCVPSAQSPPSKTVSEDVIASINNLAKMLCEKMATPASKTELLSPVSIGSMMLLLLRASKRGTRDELLNTLQLSAYRKRAGGSAIAKNFGRLLKEFTHDIAGPGILGEVPAWQATRSCNPMIDDDPDYNDDDEFLDDPPIQSNVVQLANGIFLQQGLVNNSSFVRMAKELYQAQMAHVNYREQPEEARNTINRWVNETTRGRIEEIIVDNFDRTTQMVVANALYFKATWETFFNEPQYTRPQPFFPDGEQSSSVMVPTMFTAGCFPYHSSTELDARIMGFPYRNRTTSMYVILPNSSNRAKLRELQTRLDSASLDRLIGQMRLQKAIVQFPRLHVTNSYDLKLALQQLGLRTLFNRSKSNLRALLPDNKMLKPVGSKSKQTRLIRGPSGARLRRAGSSALVFCNAELCIDEPTRPKTTRLVFHNRALYVTDMLHKINLEVNERGTEGGAVTITAMERSLPPVNFRVKAPFLIAIRHDPTKMLLFYGAIFDPS